MSAIRGLDGSLSAYSGSSQGQPAIVTGIPSNSDVGGQALKQGHRHAMFGWETGGEGSSKEEAHLN